MQRRVSKEIKLLREYGYEVVSEMTENEGSKICLNEYRFELAKNYPFKIPRMQVKMPRTGGWVSYRDVLCKIGKDFRVDSRHCLCCRSIACDNNWAPIFTMLDLILEYEKVRAWTQTRVCVRWGNLKLTQMRLGDLNLGPFLEVELFGGRDKLKSGWERFRTAKCQKVPSAT